MLQRWGRLRNRRSIPYHGRRLFLQRIIVGCGPHLEFSSVCIDRLSPRDKRMGSKTTFRHLLHSLRILTYSMEKSSSWEANRFSASQEIPRISWNPMVHCPIHKCSPPVPSLSQIDPVYTPTSHFLKIHINIIVPSTPGSPKWTLSLRFPYQSPINASPLTLTRYMPRPSHSSRFYHPKIIGWEVQIIKLTCPYPEPVRSSPQPHIPLPEDPS